MNVTPEVKWRRERRTKRGDRRGHERRTNRIKERGPDQERSAVESGAYIGLIIVETGQRLIISFQGSFLYIKIWSTP